MKEIQRKSGGPTGLIRLSSLSSRTAPPDKSQPASALGSLCLGWNGLWMSLRGGSELQEIAHKCVSVHLEVEGFPGTFNGVLDQQMGKEPLG